MGHLPLLAGWRGVPRGRDKATPWGLSFSRSPPSWGSEGRAQNLGLQGKEGGKP